MKVTTELFTKAIQLLNDQQFMETLGALEQGNFRGALARVKLSRDAEFDGVEALNAVHEQFAGRISACIEAEAEAEAEAREHHRGDRWLGRGKWA